MWFKSMVEGIFFFLENVIIVIGRPKVNDLIFKLRLRTPTRDTTHAGTLSLLQKLRMLVLLAFPLYIIRTGYSSQLTMS